MPEQKVFDPRRFVSRDVLRIIPLLQVPLARLVAGFGSASADIFQTESLCILAERFSQREIGLPLRRACHNPPLKK